MNTIREIKERMDGMKIVWRETSLGKLEKKSDGREERLLLWRQYEK